MQSYHPTEYHPTDVSNGLAHTASVLAGSDYVSIEDMAETVQEPTRFYSQFIDGMEMYAERQTVAEYFDAHHEWFRRCAQPMQVEPIGENSYALVIGRFGSFGYEVEPQIGLNLLPQQEGVYRIETVPIPGYEATGYDVDFRAAMELVESPAQEASAPSKESIGLPGKITRVQWTLDLNVSIQFPRFIHALPKSLIQSTGDRILRQVVRQVSGRLTRKVLEDFHQTYELPIPKRSRKWFFRKSEADFDGQPTDAMPGSDQ